MNPDREEDGSYSEGNVKNDDLTPKFNSKLHTKYIQSLSSKLNAEDSYEGAVTEHIRMSGVYWAVTALSILHEHEKVDEFLDLSGEILNWIFSCWDDETGGFGGNTGHDGHLLYTLSAVQLLAIMDRLDDERLDKQAIVNFVSGLQQEDGSFSGDVWGEVDTRFSYCALSCLSLLNRLDAVAVPKAAQYIASCCNFDGGFGCVPGAESHAGQVFCCIGALSIAKALDQYCDVDLLCTWLAERQCDSGGLNGRPEKQADVCYSWWILSSLCILGRMDWISKSKLADFILKCQDLDDGGIADNPNDMPDVFHTFFGIAGLSLLNYLHQPSSDVIFRKIDPVYALPFDVIQRLDLQAQIIKHNETDSVEERLQSYDVSTV
mmetsp:Transcript_31162/g.30006  ORF Transcript_31162/g.30006 Transcript_31162/m.30006 type:complete len:377 (-) Transcript_31162:68-1198(-)